MRVSALIIISAAALGAAACQNNAEDASELSATQTEADAASGAGLDAAAEGSQGSLTAESGSPQGGGTSGARTGASAGAGGAAGGESLSQGAARGVNGGATVPSAQQGQTSPGGSGVSPDNTTDTERRLNPEPNASAR